MQYEENHLTPGERELESALSRLTPSPPTFSLQQLQTQALIKSQRRQTRIWQAIAALLALSTAAAIYVAQSPRVVEKIVIRDAPQPVYTNAPSNPAPAAVTLASTEFPYLRLRDKVLSRGVDAIPEPPELPSSTKSPSVISQTRSIPDSQTPWYVNYLLSGGRS